MSRILNEISFGPKLKTGVYYITKHFNLLYQLTQKGWPSSNKPMFKQYCCKASSAEYSDINLVLFYAVKCQPLWMWHKSKDQARLVLSCTWTIHKLPIPKFSSPHKNPRTILSKLRNCRGLQIAMDLRLLLTLQSNKAVQKPVGYSQGWQHQS